jgi:hypothetical protein
MDPCYSTPTPRTHLVRRVVLLALLAVGALTVLAACANASASKAPVVTSKHLTFDILPVRPGGPAEDWPAYVATSPTALPANTVVTVTIRNFDLGDDAMPANSPYLRVQGTTDGVASADGTSYTSLDAQHVSHTFTIPQLHLNVPIPGDPVGDAAAVSVTFSFRTPPTAGTYYFQCYVPCGTGESGYNGPMATLGYMRGSLTVVA